MRDCVFQRRQEGELNRQLPKLLRGAKPDQEQEQRQLRRGPGKAREGSPGGAGQGLEVRVQVRKGGREGPA